MAGRRAEAIEVTKRLLAPERVGEGIWANATVNQRGIINWCRARRDRVNGRREGASTLQASVASARTMAKARAGRTLRENGIGSGLFVLEGDSWGDETVKKTAISRRPA
jgi:hypothetical protein